MHHHPANPQQDETVIAGLEQQVNKQLHCVLVQILTAPATDRIATKSN